MKEKRTKKWIGVSLAIAALFVLLYISYIVVASVSASKNREWGVSLSVSDNSSEGVTVTMKRTGSKRAGKGLTGDDYELQRKTLFGWKNVKYTGGNGIFTAMAYDMNEGDLKTWRLNLESVYGRLGPGIYRIRKSVIIHVDETDGAAKEEIDLELYGTFVVSGMK